MTGTEFHLYITIFAFGAVSCGIVICYFLNKKEAKDRKDKYGE
jgi:hypothetical protein